MSENKLPQRYGTLEQIGEVVNDKVECVCLAHPDQPSQQYVLGPLQDGTIYCCPICSLATIKSQHHKTHMAGRRFGDYIPLYDTGQSDKAYDKRPDGAIRDYSLHRYWRCYCVKCHTIRRIRGDVLRHGQLPTCKCQKQSVKPTNEVSRKQGGQYDN